MNCSWIRQNLYSILMSLRALTGVSGGFLLLFLKRECDCFIKFIFRLQVSTSWPMKLHLFWYDAILVHIYFERDTSRLVPMTHTEICICKLIINTHFGWKSTFPLKIVQCCCNSDCLCAYVNASGIVLCAGVNSAIGAHQELVLDQCTVDLAVGTDCFSCLLARAEPQKGKLCRLCSVMAVDSSVCMYFNISQTTNYNCIFLSMQNNPGGQPKHLAQASHFILWYWVFFSLNVSRLMDLWALTLLHRGREWLFRPGDSGTVGACGWLHRGSVEGLQGPGVCWEGGASW